MKRPHGHIKKIHQSRFSLKYLIIFSLAFIAIGTYALLHSFALPNPNLPGDLNSDNTVNTSDLSILLTNYGTTSPNADINNDGNVNILDLSVQLSHWGQSYSSANTNSLGVIRLNYEQSFYLGHMDKYSIVVLQSYMRDKIASIRQQNPNIKIYMYFNAVGLADPQSPTLDWQWPTGVPYVWAKQNHPEWFLKDAGGSDIKFWGGSLSLMDVGSSTYANEWAQRAIDYASTGGFDGIFMDDVNFGESFLPNWTAASPTYNTNLKWTQATESFLTNVSQKIHSSGLAIVPNVASEWNSDLNTSARWGQIADGYNREHFLRWGEDATSPLFGVADWNWATGLEKRIVAAGVPFYADAYGPSTGNEAQMRFIRSSYLLFWEPSSGGAFVWLTPSSSTTDLDPFNTAWAFNLGTPLGPATQSGLVWTRNFTGGTITVNPTAQTSSVTMTP